MRFANLSGQGEVSNEDDEIKKLIYKTGHVCDCCGEWLYYNDEVIVLEISECAKDPTGPKWQPIYGEDGDYQYAPYLMHLECWEEIIEEVKELLEEHEIGMEADHPVLPCWVCSSDIAAFEPYAAASFGELQVSQRCPSNKSVDRIQRMGHPKAVCLACVSYAAPTHFEAWEDLFEFLPPVVDEE